MIFKVLCKSNHSMLLWFSCYVRWLDSLLWKASIEMPWLSKCLILFLVWKMCHLVSRYCSGEGRTSFLFNCCHKVHKIISFKLPQVWDFKLKLDDRSVSVLFRNGKDIWKLGNIKQASYYTCPIWRFIKLVARSNWNHSAWLLAGDTSPLDPLAAAELSGLNVTGWMSKSLIQRELLDQNKTWNKML